MGDPSQFLLASSGAGALVIRDTTPPSIAQVTPSTASLWPPNKNMVPVSFTVSVSDNVDSPPAYQIVGVTSNEGSSAVWQTTGPLTVNPRADRADNGNGRNYVITVRCTDASGNASTATATVAVAARSEQMEINQGLASP